MAFFPDDFGLRNTVVQKPFQTKSDTSIVARVVYHSVLLHGARCEREGRTNLRSLTRL